MIIKGAVQLMKLHGIFSYHLMGGLGSYPGLPDRSAHFEGEVIYLEFKAPKGRLGKRQIEFQEQCKRDGVRYEVIRSLDDIEDIFKLRVIRGKK